MLFYSVALVTRAVMFLAVGAFASQLAATRRQAAGYAGAALGACYAIRLVADSGTGLAWLRWASPLGWVEELQPLTGPGPLALLPIAGLNVALGGGAIYLADRRDLGASILPDRASTRPHTRLLGGPAARARSSGCLAPDAARGGGVRPRVKDFWHSLTIVRRSKLEAEAS